MLLISGWSCRKKVRFEPPENFLHAVWMFSRCKRWVSLTPSHSLSHSVWVFKVCSVCKDVYVTVRPATESDWSSWERVGDGGKAETWSAELHIMTGKIWKLFRVQSSGVHLAAFQRLAGFPCSMLHV